MSDLPRAGATAHPFTLNDVVGATHVFGGSRPDAAPATLLFFFKHDCATCDLTAPVVERVQRRLSTAGLRVIGVSQDEARLTRDFAERHGVTFPCALDLDLAVSEAYGFDAVPALVLAAGDGSVLASSEGWSKAEFIDLTARAAGRCDADPPVIEPPDAAPLPAMRPGCGSRVHDPDVARRLAARRDGRTLAARRVRVPSSLDVFEFLDEQGLTDGLPVVPPTEERVARMLEATSRRSPSTRSWPVAAPTTCRS